eukprot:TRINITY_DN13101_c0_g1_i1.p1 TRINITY_DN13101_c0_g1~~TRINITY_DN13101_c0_g1_i1.p1  ORF type:complete len:146 (+),score=22.35 TRINITY_DN13101_c0_g1_i1:76-513(+)
MAQQKESNWCVVPETVAEQFAQLKKTSSAANKALVLKLNKQDLSVSVDKIYDDVLLEDIADDLPESAPRFIVYSYKWVREDSRVQFPLLLIFYSPRGSPVDMNMLAANTKRHLMEKFQLSKVFDCQDLDTLTDSWLKGELVTKFR